MPDWDEHGAALDMIAQLEAELEETQQLSLTAVDALEQEMERWSASPDCRLLERPALDLLMGAFRYSVEQIDRRGWNRWNERIRVEINGRHYWVVMQVAEIRENGGTPLVIGRRDEQGRLIPQDQEPPIPPPPR
jgi:hypothetical protein